MKKTILFLPVMIILASCPGSRRYDTGYFQHDVVNFGDLNTIYDDYNMDDPNIHYRSLFHFSSNRNSMGGDFDIVGEKMYINWSKTEGALDIGSDLDEEWFDYLVPLFDSVNTSCNELGPYTLGYRDDISYTTTVWTDILLYANDCNGDFDIKFVCCEKTNSSGSETTVMSPPASVNFVNTQANDLYPTFYGPDFYNFDEWGLDPDKIEKMLFCSDRNGNYDIFELNLPDSIDIKSFLNSGSRMEPGSPAINFLSVNSDSDDKCPHVNGKLLVFASNRSGGFGGFDLYYSLFNDGTWSEPVNFGEKINTAYDEYRPVTIYHNDFGNSLMVFSSNRPGGKGGFDLYHVGIKQMIR
ncbi:MAG: PD40 domain-containing protein [Bacteroidales bacterium]|nr:PD40 domain-containing protein [Bacteroidales bacterium]